MNELSVYERIADPMAAVAQLGNAIARSQMFGAANPEQGQILALECLARRMPPLLLKQRYHLICGQLSMRSDAMLAEFNRGGGKHFVLSRTPDLATIRLVVGEQSQDFSLSWEEMQLEPTPYAGKESDIVEQLTAGKKPPKLKPKYATPRSRMQMLWARVVSDSVRTMMPAVNCGVYTEEEVSDFAGDNGWQVAETVEANEPTKQPRGRKAAVPAVQAAKADADQVVDVEPIPTKTDSDKPGTISADDVALIRDLFAKCNVQPDEQVAVLDKRGVKSLRTLSEVQAAELIANLERLAATMQQPAVEPQQANPESVPGTEPQAADPPATSEAITNLVGTTVADSDGEHMKGPASPARVAAVKSLLADYAQIDPQIVTKIQEALAASGLKKIADMTQADVMRLEVALRNKQTEAFFQQWLEDLVPF